MKPTSKLLSGRLRFGLALPLVTASLLSATGGQKLNALFFAVDDLRPQLGLVEWIKQGTAQVEGRELYDHQNDADENANVAAHAENQDLIAKLGARLKAGWKAALPRKAGRV